MAAASLAACMTVPQLPEEHEISIEAVANRVKCELRDAAKEQTWLVTENWVGAIDLTVEIIHKGVGAGSLAFVVPVSHGTFSLGFTGGPTESAKRTVTVNFPVKIRELNGLPCRPADGVTDRRLQGDLGLIEWVQRVAGTVKRPAPPPAAAARAGRPRSRPSEDRGIGYTLEFDLLLEASVTPSFRIIPAPGQDRTGSLRLAGSRDSSHKLDISLTPESPNAQTRLRDIQLKQQFRSLRVSPQ
jgi:hypothetical protein